ncbi:MAG: uridine phosphorylase [Anaerolineae bacterium]
MPLQYHIQCAPGDVGRYVLLPGDPGRCALIAQHFDSAVLVAQNREFTTYTGTLLDETVSVTSTGIGGPSTAIAVEELAAIGADTFIRVGTSGGMQPYTQIGDLVIATAAVRDEGTSRQYLPVEFPSVADPDVVWALRQAARRTGVRHHVGIVHSKDSFYGEVQPKRMPIARRLLERWEAWVKGGALCSEMEAATLFVVASVLGKRASALLLVGGITSPDSEPGNPLQEEPQPSLDLHPLIRTAVEALRILIQRDRENEATGPGESRSGI